MKFQSINTKWVFIIVLVAFSAYNLKDSDITSVSKLSVSEFLPLAVLVVIIILFKTSILTGGYALVKKLFIKTKSYDKK